VWHLTQSPSQHAPLQELISQPTVERPLKQVDRPLRVLSLVNTTTEACTVEHHLSQDEFHLTSLAPQTTQDLCDALDQLEPHVLLCHHPASSLDLVSTLQLLGERYPTLPIVVWASDIDVRDVVALMRAGAADCLTETHLGRLSASLQDAALRRISQDPPQTPNKDRYRQVSELLSDYAYSFKALADGNLQVEWIIGGFERITGFTIKETEARGGWTALIYPEDRSSADARAARLYSGKPDVSEFRIVRKDGAIRWLRDHAKPITDDKHGDVVRIVGAAKDITQHKQTEGALRESEHRFQALIEHLTDAVFVQTEYRFAYVNPAALRLYGAEHPQQLLGQPIMDRFHPADHKGIADQIEQVNKDKLVVPIVEQIHLQMDGTPIHVEVSSAPIHYEGQDGSVVVVHDISPRRQAQEQLNLTAERLSLATQAARIGIWDLDLTNGHITWDACMYEQYGIQPENFHGTQEVWNEAVHPEDQPTMRQRVRDSIEGKEVPIHQFRIIRPDGQTRFIEGGVKVLRDPDGTMKRVIGVSTDITHRKELEHQFIQAQKMEAVGKLAGGIAHDFNNLLVPIIGYTEMAQADAPSDSELSTYLESIRSAADRAAELTQQILAFSRQQVLQMEILDLNLIVQEFDIMLRRLIGEDIECTTLLSSHLKHVKGDKSQLEQVLLNLAVNARDAMPNGGTLTIQTENLEVDESRAVELVDVEPGSYCLLTVSDTGEGMDKVIQQRIFEPFFTTKPDGQGTGLGLSTVFGIVRQHGGAISVHSERGKGASFQVYLPAVETGTLFRPQTPTHTSDLHGSETILIVEDDPNVRGMVADALKRYGYHVLVAEDPRECLALARTHQGVIHMLLTDVILPQMRGTELCRHVAHQHPDIKVIFMSGYTDSITDDPSFANSEHGFIHKPFAIRVLLEKIRTVLD
jgi:two-component system, cell cycle sensor histidine kinase and response regulator CckA